MLHLASKLTLLQSKGVEPVKLFLLDSKLTSSQSKVTDQGRGGHNCFILIQSLIISYGHRFCGPRPVNFVRNSKFLFRTTFVYKNKFKNVIQTSNFKFSFQGLYRSLILGKRDRTANVNFKILPSQS